MPKTVLSEQHEWARILYAVNPDGRVPAEGPATAVAAFAEQTLATDRAFEPRKIEADDLLAPGPLATVSGWVDKLAGEAQDVYGRGIINLPAAQKAELRALGIIERIEERAGVRFAPAFEALLMYYNDTGNLPLHVDDQAEYRFNALVCLRRVRPIRGTSTGTLFWLSTGPASIDLDEGEAVVFDAHYTPHGRLPLSNGDEIVMLSLGFTTAGEDPAHE
jgi:hypothetical protein